MFKKYNLFIAEKFRLNEKFPLLIGKEEIKLDRDKKTVWFNNGYTFINIKELVVSSDNLFDIIFEGDILILNDNKAIIANTPKSNFKIEEVVKILKPYNNNTSYRVVYNKA